MKWLLLTDNNDISSDLQDCLTSLEKKNKLSVSDFDTANLKKQKKHFADYAACVIFSDTVKEYSPQEISTIAGVAGYIISLDVTVITNLKFIADTNFYDKNQLKFISERKEIFATIGKNYKTLSANAKKRLAKKKLLDRGIPFTSDCFATYIAKNKIEIFNEFLEAGMSVNSRDDMGVPMLNIACRNDNFEFVEMLLDLGAELNASSDDRGYTAVMDAVWRGNEKITKFLIEKGADLNTISKEGQSNLVLAVGADRYNICKLLVENGSDPDVKDMMGMSAYQYATLFRKEKIAEILRPYHKEQ